MDICIRITESLGYTPETNTLYINYACVHAKSLSCGHLSATLWTIAHQAALSMGFSRQKYWSGLPWPPPEDLPDPGVKPASLASPALAGGFFTTSTTQEAHKSTVRQRKIKIKSKRI